VCCQRHLNSPREGWIKSRGVEEKRKGEERKGREHSDEDKMTTV